MEWILAACLCVIFPVEAVHCDYQIPSCPMWMYKCVSTTQYTHCSHDHTYSGCCTFLEPYVPSAPSQGAGS